MDPITAIIVIGGAALAISGCLDKNAVESKEDAGIGKEDSGEKELPDQEPSQDDLPIYQDLSYQVEVVDAGILGAIDSCIETDAANDLVSMPNDVSTLEIESDATSLIDLPDAVSPDARYFVCDGTDTPVNSEELDQQVANLHRKSCNDSIPIYEDIMANYPCYSDIKFVQYELGLCYAENLDCDKGMEYLCPFEDDEEFSKNLDFTVEEWEMNRLLIIACYSEPDPIIDPSQDCSTTVLGDTKEISLECTFKDISFNFHYVPTSCPITLWENLELVDCSELALSNDEAQLAIDSIKSIESKFAYLIEKWVVFQNDSATDLAFNNLAGLIGLRYDIDGNAGAFQNTESLPFVINHEVGHSVLENISDENRNKYFEIIGASNAEKYCNDFAQYRLGGLYWRTLNNGTMEAYNYFKDEIFCGREYDENQTADFQFMYSELLPCDLALNEFQKIADNFPYSDYVPESFLGQTDCNSYLGECEKAIDDLEQIKISYAGIARNHCISSHSDFSAYQSCNTNYDSFAQYQIGLVHWDCMWDFLGTFTELDKVVVDFPNTMDALNALYVEAFIWKNNMHNCDKAIPILEKITDEYYDNFDLSYTYDQAFFDLGSCYYDNGDCENALPNLTRFVNDFGSDPAWNGSPIMEEAQEMIATCK